MEEYKSIKDGIYEYLSIIPHIKEINNINLVENFRFHLKYKYNRFFTEETISRKWREIRFLSGKVKFDNDDRLWIQIKNPIDIKQKTLCYITKIKNDKRYDRWEFKYE